MKLVVVSSRATLFLRLLLPTLWISVHLALFLFSILGGVAWSVLALPFLSLLGFMWLWYVVFRPLRWVGVGEDGLYVSDYFKSVRYGWESFAGLEEEAWGPFRRIRLRLHGGGIWGSELNLLASYNWYYILQQRPTALRAILGGGQAEDKPTNIEQ